MLQIWSSEAPKTEVLRLLFRPLFGGLTWHLEHSRSKVRERNVTFFELGIKSQNWSFAPAIKTPFWRVNLTSWHIQNLNFERKMLQFLSLEAPKVEVLRLLLRPLFQGLTWHLECSRSNIQERNVTVFELGSPKKLMLSPCYEGRLLRSDMTSLAKFEKERLLFLPTRPIACKL